MQQYVHAVQASGLQNYAGDHLSSENLLIFNLAHTLTIRSCREMINNGSFKAVLELLNKQVTHGCCYSILSFIATIMLAIHVNIQEHWEI